jgi:MFS transporter, ACS family, solute carrier family 17 (sodium-dependent inorganic phosphate cotransporter), other
MFFFSFEKAAIDKSTCFQIVGGIWADKIGGKIVLGFGVVWWSIATILTPLAAKISLPCLLIMRAFMGIGEVSSFYSLN